MKHAGSFSCSLQYIGKKISPEYWSTPISIYPKEWELEIDCGSKKYLNKSGTTWGEGMIQTWPNEKKREREIFCCGAKILD